MCPKTGDPHYPVCCSVDGKVATKQDCKCGETGECSSGQFCTASTNTCEYPVCSNTDGSKVLVLEGRCQCGTNSCSAGQECTTTSNTCEFPMCSTTDGSAVATNAKTGCKCDRYNTCTTEGDTCDGKQNRFVCE